MKLRIFLISLLIAGVALWLVALWFWVIGSGLPYQDPTTEMQINWLANNLAGTMCAKIGAVIFALGAVGLIVARIIKRKNK